MARCKRLPSMFALSRLISSSFATGTNPSMPSTIPTHPITELYVGLSPFIPTYSPISPPIKWMMLCTAFTLNSHKMLWVKNPHIPITVRIIPRIKAYVFCPVIPTPPFFALLHNSYIKFLQFSSYLKNTSRLVFSCLSILS